MNKVRALLCFCAVLSGSGNLLFAQNSSSDYLNEDRRHYYSLFTSVMPGRPGNTDLVSHPVKQESNRRPAFHWKFEDVSVTNDSLFLNDKLYARYIMVNQTRTMIVLGLDLQDLLKVQWNEPDNKGNISYVFTFTDTKRHAAITLPGAVPDIMLYAIAKNKLIENGARLNAKAEKKFIKAHRLKKHG